MQNKLKASRRRRSSSLLNLNADESLLALLIDARAAETASAVACQLDDDATAAEARAELADTVAAMAATPASGWLGVAAKAARLCRSLAADEGFGDTMEIADVPLARSLAADIARLAPQVKA